MEMSIKDYHQNDALGSSDIRAWINGCPAKWLHRKENRVATDSMNFGQLVHTMVLEPEKLEEEFVISPYDSFRTKEAREWKKEMLAKGIDIIDSKLLTKADLITKKINEHTGAKKLLSGIGQNEQSYFWTDEKTGLKLKFRPDRLQKMSIIDLKTTQDASPKGFLRAIEKYSYWIQAGFYVKGFKAEFGFMPDDFLIIAVETSYPFEVAVYEIPKTDILLGIEVVDKALRQIKEAQENNEYLGYNGKNEKTILEISNWTRSKYENE